MRTSRGLLIGCLLAALLSQQPAIAQSGTGDPTISRAPFSVAKLGFQLRRSMRRGETESVRELLQISTRIEPRTPRQAKELHRYLLDVMIKYPIAFDSAANALAVRGVDELQPSFDSWLDNSSARWERTSAILDVASRLKGTVSEQWLLWALEHRVATIRRVAMNGLARRKSKSAIPRLIRFLETAELNGGAVPYTAHQSLVALTGQDYQLVADWRNFWEIHKDHFDPMAPLKASAGETSTAAPEVEGPTFFGVRIPSHRVLFVIDISASMAMLDDGEAGARVRMNRAKQQLKKAIRTLPARAKFNVIAFNHRIHKFRERLTRADEDSTLEAAYWINRLQSGGATHTGQALREAFRDDGVDTIVLLSDGAPSRTGGPPMEKLAPHIIASVDRRNQLRHVRIFTFGFEGTGYWPANSPHSGSKSTKNDLMSWFLEELARRNDGGYKPI